MHRLLKLARSTAWPHRPVSETTLALMRRIERATSAVSLCRGADASGSVTTRGHTVGRRQVATLMRRMGITAIYRKPRTSQRHPAHQIYPYLLRQLTITRPNHVWASDISYIPMRRGCIFVRDSRLGRSPSVGVAAVQHVDDRLLSRGPAGEALSRYGKPEIFNTDQGCQFTSQDFTGLLNEEGIQISMDGTGRWRDNVFVERLWRSLKYEEVYLHAYETIHEAHQGVTRYVTFYNQLRPHRALDGRTPDRVYWDTRPARPTAA
ncbi:MAG: IS3 family transposase [Nitrospira sp.]|nr:IS3 family transposase [Nitrospira sp.]